VKERISMNLNYAVDRLLDTGWSPAECDAADLERLPDGPAFPSIEAVRREFARAGLELSLKQNFMFSCEREAAVYALAQLRAFDGIRSLVGA
jgi:hypothetical protein